jgi:hypothetical protein
LTVSGSGWPAGDSIFVQIGSATFGTDVVCVLVASSGGAISGPPADCPVPTVPAGSQQLVAIDDQNQGVKATGTAFKVVAGLTLTPSGAVAGAPVSPGTTVSITGGGFAAGSTVSGFHFDTAPLATSPASVGTGPNGSFVSGVTFTVPSTTAGTHTISATDGSANKNKGSATLRVYTPKVSVSPTSGSPGGGLTVSGSGWPAGDSIFVQIGSATFGTDVVCVLVASSGGAISGPPADCPVPTVPAGSQQLVAIDDQNQGVRTTGASFKVT